MAPVVRGAGEVATQLPSTRADSCLLVHEQCSSGAEASEIKGTTKSTKRSPQFRLHAALAHTHRCCTDHSLVRVQGRNWQN